MTITGDIPVACTLTGAAQERRMGEVAIFFRRAEHVESLPDGYAFRFPGSREAVATLAGFLAAERECCPFLAYELVCEPGHGAVWLRLRGRDEAARAFVRETFVPRVRGDADAG